MCGVADFFKGDIKEMTNGTEFKLINLLHAKNPNLTHEDLNTRIYEPGIRWNIHLVSYDTLTSREKPSSNGQLSKCEWSFGIMMSPIGITIKTVWAGELRWLRELDTNIKSQLHRDYIHSMTGVFRWCGCFQVGLKIQRMILWWKSMVLRHWILQWIVWCMLSGLKTKKLNRMWRSGWFGLQSHGQSGGGQHQNLPIENHSSGYLRRMHISLISCGLRKSKHFWRPR